MRVSSAIPLSLDPLWVPRALTTPASIAGGRGADPVVYEMHDGREISHGSSYDVRKRVFRVDNATSLDEAMDVMGVPAVGNAHPKNPYIVVKDRLGELLGRSSYKITVTYDYPGLSQWNPQGRRLRWTIGSTTQRWDVDLDGQIIGERCFWNRDSGPGGSPQMENGTAIFDPDVVYGMEAEITDVSLEIVESQPAAWVVQDDASFWHTVNDNTFFGLVPGCCLYNGASAEQISATGWALVRHFKAGIMSVPPAFIADAGGSYIGIEFGVWWRFKKVSERRVPTQLMKARRHFRSNFDLLLTTV